MRKFFACSVGDPNKDYDEENLQRIIENRAFVLHEDTIQKGVYEAIEEVDIILLKYKNNFVAYAQTTGKQIAEVPEWNFDDDFKKADIAFVKYAERDFQSIEGKSEEEAIKIIHSDYQKLREKDNEIRNNLKLMDTRLHDLVMPIKTAK